MSIIFNRVSSKVLPVSYGQIARMQKTNEETSNFNVNSITVSQSLNKYPNWNNWFQASYGYNIVNKGPELMKCLDLMLKDNLQAKTHTVIEQKFKKDDGYEGGAVLFNPMNEKIA